MPTATVLPAQQKCAPMRQMLCATAEFAQIPRATGGAVVLHQLYQQQSPQGCAHAPGNVGCWNLLKRLDRPTHLRGKGKQQQPSHIVRPTVKHRIEPYRVVHGKTRWRSKPCGHSHILACPFPQQKQDASTHRIGKITR